MTRQNLFDGESYHAMFAKIVYKWLTTNKWVTYADVMADFLMLASSKELPRSVSKCENYGELRKAFSAVRNAIRQEVGIDCIEERGNNRNKSFRYIGEKKDPLVAMRNAKTIKDLKKYWQFCQDSAGFFPKSWLEYFFKDCQDLLDMKSKKQKGEQTINSSLDRLLTNIELLPMLYEAIKNHQILSIDYKPYEEGVASLVFHPHFLKEYNGRWYLFGHAEGHEPEEGYNIALDRIEGHPREVYDKDYIAAPEHFYDSYFEHIVGVTHPSDAAPQHIYIRTHSLYIYKLTETKPLHHSQEVRIPFGKYEDGEYGEFMVYVEVNNEFIGRILQMGDGLEVVYPESVRQMMKERVETMAKQYSDTE